MGVIAMRTLITLTTATVIALAPMAAFAATMTTTGTVKSVDAKAGSVTLDNGTTYMLPAGYSHSKLKAGEKVKISWEKKASKFVADNVTMVN
tara:strand:- start:6881 stop:7156 length:276 start_codon:yes stop_codon:yes gene_type:complete